MPIRWDHEGRRRASADGWLDCLLPGTDVEFSVYPRRGEHPQRQGGVVAGTSVYDQFMATTWVPVRPAQSANDIPPLWVRSVDIVVIDDRPE